MNTQPATASQTPVGIGDDRAAVSFPFSIVVLVWAGMALVGGLIVVAYLGLGAVMTHSLEGVFGPEATFNWVLLWTALIGQLVGLLASILVALLAVRARKQGKRLATAGMVMGFVAAGVFLLIGLIQLPLVSLLFDALAL